MKQTSKVKGVHWSPAIRKWIARTPGKKILCKGHHQKEAELARLKYDSETKYRQPQAKPRKQTKMFNSIPDCCWAVTDAPYGLEQSYEK